MFTNQFTDYLCGFQGRPRLSSCIFCICWCTLILGLSKTFDLLFNMKITKNISKVSNTFLFLQYYSSTNTQQPEYQSGHYSFLRFFPSLTYYLPCSDFKLLYNQLEIIYMYSVHYIQQFIVTRAWGGGVQFPKIQIQKNEVALLFSFFPIFNL